MKPELGSQGFVQIFLKQGSDQIIKLQSLGIWVLGLFLVSLSFLHGVTLCVLSIFLYLGFILSLASYERE